MGPDEQPLAPALVAAALRQAMGNTGSINGSRVPPSAQDAARLLAGFNPHSAGAVANAVSRMPGGAAQQQHSAAQAPSAAIGIPPTNSGVDRFIPSLDLAQMRRSNLLQNLFQPNCSSGGGEGFVGDPQQPMALSGTVVGGRPIGAPPVGCTGGSVPAAAATSYVTPAGASGFGATIVSNPVQQRSAGQRRQPNHPAPQTINLTPRLPAGIPSLTPVAPPSVVTDPPLASMGGTGRGPNDEACSNFISPNGYSRRGGRGGFRGGYRRIEGLDPGVVGGYPHSQRQGPYQIQTLQVQRPQRLQLSATSAQLQISPSKPLITAIEKAAAAKEATDILKEVIRNSLMEQDRRHAAAQLQAGPAGRGGSVSYRGTFRGGRGGRGGASRGNTGIGAVEWKSQPSIPTYGTPTADCMVARSMLKAQPSPFKPPVKLGNGAELTWDEEGSESRWLIDDHAAFYRQDRLQPSAEQQGKRNLHDLNIVMPIVIPGAEIRVHNVDGENYYNLSHRDLGAHLLFGRDSTPSTVSAMTKEAAKPSSPPTGDTAPETEKTDDGKVDASKPDAQGEVTAAVASAGDEPAADHQDFPVAAPLPVDDNTPPAVCDIWASFLHIQLGVLRNCRAEQIPEIVRLFHKAFTEDNWASFPTPIEIECKGIYPAATADSSAKGGEGEGSNFERYETRGVFLGDIDRRRFRVVRRRLKKFLLMLWDQFGVDAGGPRFDATLNPNCRTGESDFVRVEIRRYSPLIHSGLLKHIWSDQPAAARAANAAPPEAITDVKLSEAAEPVVPRAKVMASEIRLELTHARMIDPRWTKQWVLARRMPALPTTTATSRPLLARHVFAPKGVPNLPAIVYEFPNPKSALLQSRFSPLYLLADVVCRDAEAATAELASFAHQALKQDRAIISASHTKEIKQDIKQTPGSAATANAGVRASTLVSTAAIPSQTASNVAAVSTNLSTTSENNSILRASAVPFYPLANVLQTLTQGTLNLQQQQRQAQQGTFVPQPAGATAWDKLVTMAGGCVAGTSAPTAAQLQQHHQSAFPLHPTIADFDGTKEVDGQALLNAIFNNTSGSAAVIPAAAAGRTVPRL